MPAISCADKNKVSENEVKNVFPDMENISASKRILVRFKPGTDSRIIKKIQEKYGLETVKPLSTQGLYLMKITGEMKIKTVIKELKKHDEVIYAEPDFKYQVND